MKINLKQSAILFAGITAAFLSSCSKDKPLIPEEPVVPAKGIYILNEGIMNVPGSSSLSYLDLETSELTSNIFSKNNPDKAMGNGATDMDVYGNLLFITATESKTVQILNASTAKVVATVSVEQPRFIAFHSGKAFITSYANKVVVIDTISKSVQKEIPVGRTPEGIIAIGDKIYVANSGAHDAITGDPEGYDNTVSIINPGTLQEEGKIEVADNVYHLYVDSKDNLYANTMDIWEGSGSDFVLKEPSRLYKINTTSKTIDKRFDFGTGLMSFYQNKAYLISYNYPGNEKAVFVEMDLNTLASQELTVIPEEKLNFPYFPYGLAINPENGDIWYSNTYYETSPGNLFQYNSTTKETKDYTVGLYPSTFIFR